MVFGKRNGLFIQVPIVQCFLSTFLQNNEPNLPEVKEGRYCQVFGLIRVYEGRKTIMILKMFQVDNINIITNHLLQVIHVRLEAEAMSKEGVNFYILRHLLWVIPRVGRFFMYKLVNSIFS